MRTFVWDLSFGNFRLIAFVWDPSFENFRFGTFALELELRSFCLEILAWTLSFLGTISSKFDRLESFDEDLSLAIFRDLSLGNAQPRKPAGTFASDFALGNFRLRSSALRLWAGNFRLGFSAWELSLDSFRLGSFVWELSL